MSDEEQLETPAPQDKRPSEPPAATAPEPVASEGEPVETAAVTAEAAPSDIAPTALVEALRAEIERVASERDDLKSKYLSAMAEADNIRKRADKEKIDLKKYAISDFAREVLTISDNISRALEAIPAEAADRDPSVKSIREGVELLGREVVSSLERHGVTRIAAEGERFNPHFHQAVNEIESAELPPGTVVEVYRPGYMIGERVLRSAMVAVSKAVAAPASAAPAEATAPMTEEAPKTDEPGA
jgi:molecular chaperone GrpE